MPLVIIGANIFARVSPPRRRVVSKWLTEKMPKTWEIIHNPRDNAWMGRLWSLMPILLEDVKNLLGRKTVEIELPVQLRIIYYNLYKTPLQKGEKYSHII
jgi:hypothetical protein